VATSQQRPEYDDRLSSSMCLEENGYPGTTVTTRSSIIDFQYGVSNYFARNNIVSTQLKVGKEENDFDFQT